MEASLGRPGASRDERVRRPPRLRGDAFGVVLTRTTDALGRDAGFALDGGHAVAYAYDMYGRLHRVSSSVASDTIPWHFALEADNADGPDFPYAEIVAVINPPGTNDPDVVSTTTGHLYAPPQSETLTYDDDGNLLSDGRWHYTWNGENRLVKAEEQVSPTNREPYTVEYAYDHQGRMVWKQVSTNAVVLSTRSILWDGYNIIAETIHSTVPSIQSSTNLYVWGLDIAEQSGAGLPRHSAPGASAGGVGGLLAEVRDGAFYTAAYDANGNVTEYADESGNIEAHYEYDPFGNTVVQSGDMADSFTHRFSTKPWCGVTGLSEYLFRKYSPSMGRWLSRDPIGDRDGDLYCFVSNDPIADLDILGLASASTYTYAEIREWAVKKSAPPPVDFSAPAGLGDAKASIGAICARNGMCATKDGSTATAPADTAAWRNINAASGSDKTGTAWFMCVGSENCWFVTKCYACVCDSNKVWSVKLILRGTPLTASATVVVQSNQGGTLYFYNDNLKGWCDATSYNLGQAGCKKKNSP